MTLTTVILCITAKTLPAEALFTGLYNSQGRIFMHRYFVCKIKSATVSCLTASDDLIVDHLN